MNLVSKPARSASTALFEVESSIFDSTGNWTPLMAISSALTSPPTASATAFWSVSAFVLSMLVIPLKPKVVETLDLSGYLRPKKSMSLWCAPQADSDF